MLRVGLTGGLGSGKSTVARMLLARGAYVLESDAIGRELMEPGQQVYGQVLEHFGQSVMLPDGALNRAQLARIAFGEGRVDELNRIVHPAVIAEQTERAAAIGRADSQAVIVVESALIFETKFGAEHKSRTENHPWSRRFDRIVLVIASEELKLARFVERGSGGRPLSGEERDRLEADARRRLAQQIPDAEKAPWCDFVIPNDAGLNQLEAAVDQLWPQLQVEAAGAMPPPDAKQSRRRPG